jgi:hypothetical protein
MDNRVIQEVIINCSGLLIIFGTLIYGSVLLILAIAKDSKNKGYKEK